MRLSRFIILPALVYGTLSASAQDVTEAYNFSNLTVQGTARSMGFGNTLGSVGGDFSSLSVNPAGLGVYRSSEISLTPSLRMNGAKGEYAGETTQDNNTRFNINQFGLVFTSAPKGKRYDTRSWKAVSFAFGMNRVADFNRNYTYAGRNTTSSASQAFEADANLYPGDVNSVDPTNALGYIGYQSYLLNATANGQFYSIVPFSGGINQMKSIQERGSINEWVISLGGNYKEKLMLGVTIGLPSIRYKRSSHYTESVAAGNTSANPDNFNSFTYRQSLDISGNGINAKLGAIYKFSTAFRAGIAFHSPTFYSITDIYDPGMSSISQNFTTILTINDALVRNQFDYTMSTPWKGVLSATYMINKLGFITVDYEYVDYSSTRYRYPEGYDPFSGLTNQQLANAMNQEIKKTYRGVSNFRIGGEGRIGKYFMARAGFGYYGDPYSAYGKTVAPTYYTTERIDISLGAGFRFQHFFTDIGLVHSRYQGYEQPYAVDYSAVISGAPVAIPTAKMNYALNNLAWTIGVKF